MRIPSSQQALNPDTSASPAAERVGSASPEQAEAKPFLCRKPVRATIYTFLTLFLAALIASQVVPPLLDPTFEKHIQSHRVMVGMTREQVLQAWGSPNTINVSFTKDGIRREEWIFEDWESAAVVKHRYLYFEEGKLVGGWYKGSDQRIPTKPTTGPPQFPQRPF
ncbi:MAG TPA: hypothetical protein VNK46_16425 [Nitrospiraceae bacterium]|jgi:hypothetical protein|nr:hypothetical protein [Nitrospiraceae bacterium]